MWQIAYNDSQDKMFQNFSHKQEKVQMLRPRKQNILFGPHTSDIKMFCPIT